MHPAQSSQLSDPVSQKRQELRFTPWAAIAAVFSSAFLYDAVNEEQVPLTGRKQLLVPGVQPISYRLAGFGSFAASA